MPEQSVETLTLKVQTLEKELGETQAELKEANIKIANLETRMTVNERDIKSVFERLMKIESNTTWILRIIISTLILGILGYFYKFPVH
jgi:chromosome segregation ATPase